MNIFRSEETARVFGLPTGCDFSKSFLDGLKHRLKDAPPEAMARVEIFTNTRRAARRWEELLIGSGACLLPQIRVITDLGNDVLADPPVTEVGTPLARRLMMMRAVRALLESGHSLAPASASFDLAGTLQTLMDEMDGEGVSPGALNDLDVEDHSDHWQTSLQFLRIINETALATDAAPLGSDSRQRAVVAALAARWETDPPAHPILVAGSTGSRGTTAMFMDAVRKLPQGGVILPGFDFELNPRSWEALATPQEPPGDHPQFGFAQLCERFGLSAEDVLPWHEVEVASPARNRLMSLALRPAPVTDEWLKEAPDHADYVIDTTAGISLLKAPNERFEATAIALALRQAVAHEQRAVLITPDATLSRRVTAALQRWGIVPDDSAGVPLRLTPPAIFLDLILQAAGTDTHTTDFLAILKHPLCAAGSDRGAHLALTRRLDAELLRDIGPYVDWPMIHKWAESLDPAWSHWLETVFGALIPSSSASLGSHLELHKTAAMALVAGPPGENNAPLWDKVAGEKVRAVLTELETDADAAGEIDWFDYATILRSLLSADTVREEGFLPDKRVAIWGQLEARVQNADLIILGGLNEGVWPSLPAPDPWLSRPMRRALGLQLPERRIGLAAHDFQQAVANGKVVLSRSIKQDNTPTVPSRWLTRFENLLTGMGHNGQSALDKMAARGARYVQLAQLIDQPEKRAPPEPRPSPAPPLAVRPSRISVTQVERLIRDPFEIYANKVLRLTPLPRVGRVADARDRGTSFHKVMEHFVREIPEIPDNARALFEEMASQVLNQTVPWPVQRLFWQGRLMRVADDFIAREHERRANSKPHLFEVKGKIAIPMFSRALTLSAMADRIDMVDDGTVAIYDYKSSLPSVMQDRLFSKQLQLEAYIAVKGGFDGLSPIRAGKLELISLSKPGDSQELDCEPDEISKIWDEFLTIIAYFEEPRNGYAARLRPMRIDQWGDFDHLARRGEWEDNADHVVEVLDVL